jgi:prephenate dehydratase/chorismate mutase
MSKENLEIIRKQIDLLDENLIDLLAQRFTLVEKISIEKEGMQEFKNSKLDQDRKNKVQNNFILNAKKFNINDNFAVKLYNLIHDYSLALEEFSAQARISINQEDTNTFRRLYFLGPKYSYSYNVATKLSKLLENKFTLYSCECFKDIYNKLINSTNCIAILPLENFSTSNILENVHYLFDKKLEIIGECIIDINLCLIGLTSSNNIKRIYSHKKALEQASVFIENFDKIESKSTSDAVNQIIQNNNNEYAAIASKESISEYPNLKILAENIQNHSNNKTRFIYVAKLENTLDIFHKINKKINKFTILVKLNHTKGSLLKLLECFSGLDINLTKIDSVPIASKVGEYEFFIEGRFTKFFENKQQLINELDTIKTFVNSYFLIGAYECFDL